MSLKNEFESLLDKLDSDREELQLKLHLASMDARDEFEEAEKLWRQIKNKAAAITDESVDTSEGFIAKAKMICEELNNAYHRIAQRISE